MYLSDGPILSPCHGGSGCRRHFPGCRAINNACRTTDRHSTCPNMYYTTPQTDFFRRGRLRWKTSRLRNEQQQTTTQPPTALRTFGIRLVRRVFRACVCVRSLVPSEPSPPQAVLPTYFLPAAMVKKKPSRRSCPLKKLCRRDGR